jgi:hypothetical protein
MAVSMEEKVASIPCGVRQYRDIVISRCAAWSTKWLDVYDLHMCQLWCTMSSKAVQLYL